MARNEEKAMGLLNRWTTYQREYQLGMLRKGRRGLASDCDNLPEALRTRRELVHEITGKINEIQNASLGEHRLRELNDEINKLLRIKWHWEKQIRELGGPSRFDDDAGQSFGHGGGPESPDGGKTDLRTYRYFGAARDLPQVRELLMKPTPRKLKKRKREEILKNISCSYFASIENADDDLNGLLAAEDREEKIQAALRLESVKSEDKPKQQNDHHDRETLDEFEAHLMKTVEYSSLPFLTPEQRTELDTTKVFEKLLVERKKKELMAKFML